MLVLNQDLSESSSDTSSSSYFSSASTTTTTPTTNNSSSSSDFDDLVADIVEDIVVLENQKVQQSKQQQQQPNHNHHHHHHHHSKIRMPKLKKNTNNKSTCNNNIHRHPFYETEDEATRRIRSQYLSRLGLTSTASKQQQQHREVKSILKQKKRENKNKTSSQKRVTFRDHIVSSIHIIPSRCEYTKDESLKMWMIGNEYDYVVMKNTIEYMAEGCNPDHVLEEDQFILYDDLLVHPVHLLDF